MDFLMWLPKFLAELAYKVFADRKDLERQQKANLANLLDRIADCMKKMSDSIANRNVPDAECAELAIYIKQIKSIVEKVTDIETAKALTWDLYFVEAVPGVAVRHLEQELMWDTKPSRFKAKRYRQSKQSTESQGN